MDQAQAVTPSSGGNGSSKTANIMIAENAAIMILPDAKALWGW